MLKNQTLDNFLLSAINPFFFLFIVVISIAKRTSEANFIYASLKLSKIRWDPSIVISVKSNAWVLHILFFFPLSTFVLFLPM